MAMQGKSRPPLIDPLHVRELFVTEVAQVGFTEGNFLVTLACLRAEESVAGRVRNLTRVVVCRLVLTSSAASQLFNELQGLSHAFRTATQPRSDNPN